MSDGRLFAYDIQRPVTIDVLASEERNGARVDDIRYGPESVEAYLMAPLGSRRRSSGCAAGSTC